VTDLNNFKRRRGCFHFLRTALPVSLITLGPGKFLASFFGLVPTLYDVSDGQYIYIYIYETIDCSSFANVTCFSVRHSALVREQNRPS